MLFVDFLFEVITAAKPFPRHEFANLRTKRDCRKEGEAGIFRRVIAWRRPAGFEGALGDCIEALERRDKIAWLEELDVQLAISDVLDVLQKANGRCTQMRPLAAEGALHFPMDLFGVGRRAENQSTGKPKSQAQKLNPLEFHFFILP